jgi:peptide/nickel transport system ATP-binding protein
VTAAGAPLLSVGDLTVALPRGADRPFAIEGVGFDLKAAEILCIVGESGSGKSVLSSAIMGALPAGLSIARGGVALGRDDLTHQSESAWRALRGRRIAMIPQEPMAALNPVTRVGRQIEEVFAIHGRWDRGRRRVETLRLIDEMGLPDPQRIAAAYPHQLSGGQCQRVCIAMALALKPEVLIADEPTTALDVTTQAQVLSLIRALRDQHRQGVLFITHDLGVVADIADRVAVMRQGRMVEIGPVSQILQSPSHPYTQALIAAVPSFTPAPRPKVVARDGPGAGLKIAGLSKSYGATQALKATDLEIERATTLAIVGESGSGKSTLAKLLVRLVAPTGGVCMVNGADLARLSGRPLRDARRSIQMIFQDPFGSLNPRRSVGSMIARAARLGGDKRGQAVSRAKDLLRRVGLDPAAYDRPPSAFSGGQRQRVGVARALAIRPDVLIADESVSALDVSIQAQVLALLRDLQQDLGLTIVFITHDLRVAAQVSDRIAVMRAGEIVETGETAALLARPEHPYTQALIDAAPGRKTEAPTWHPKSVGEAES